jgi:hypothetical protein
MTPITTATDARTILAIDLGKYKSVACVHDSRQRNPVRSSP